MKRIFFTISAITLLFLTSAAQRPARFHCEQSDTTVITNALIKLDAIETSETQRLVAEAAKIFVGHPYVAGTLEHSPEMLTVNVDEFDCTTFVETCIAMATTIESNRTSWHDFLYNLEQVRYRGGIVDGYASRLHYISDWIVDNSYRGILQEVTARIGNAKYVIKTIDFMSSNRSKYKALEDDKNFSGIKNAEIGYRSHRFPIIQPQHVKAADIREGDIIAITTSIKNLDVTHMGIATIIDGMTHMIHASSKAGKVIIDPLPLHEYLRKNRSATGIRVIRLRK